MNHQLGSSLFCALFATLTFGATETRAAATLAASPTRMDGFAMGDSANGKGADVFASPGAVSLAAAKEIGEASSSLRVWVEEVLAAAGVLSLATAAVLAFRRRRRDRAHRLQTLFAIADTPLALSDRQTPRCLPTNPYLDADGPAVLSRQIENAAEASLEFGRVLGVIYFDLGASPKGDFSDEALNWGAERSELLEKLRKALRPTDHVAALSDHEIVACIALLPGKTELVTVANRLRKVGQASARFSGAFLPEAGLAIYPACGYRGEELIDHARSDFHVRKPPAMGFLPLNAPALESAAAPKA